MRACFIKLKIDTNSEKLKHVRGSQLVVVVCLVNISSCFEDCSTSFITNSLKRLLLERQAHSFFISSSYSVFQRYSNNCCCSYLVCLVVDLLRMELQLRVRDSFYIYLSMLL